MDLLRRSSPQAARGAEPPSADPSAGGRLQAAAHTAATALAYVVEPGGPCNVYAWDEARQALMLTAVERPAEPRGADLVRLPLSMTRTQTAQADAAAPALLALLLATPANPAGAWVRVRVLGALCVTAGVTADAAPMVNPPAPFMSGAEADDAGANALNAYIALAVPVADAALADVSSLDTLPAPLRERALAALASVVPEARTWLAQRLAQGPVDREQDPPGRWLEAEQVMARYRAARAALSHATRDQQRAGAAFQAERLTSSAEEAGEILRQRLARESTPVAPEAPGLPSPGERQEGTERLAWRGIAALGPAELRARGMAAYGETADLARWLPERFTRYLSGLLAPDERALFFVEAPRFVLHGWTEPDTHRSPVWRPSALLAGRRTRTLNDGLLLVTDRQMLLLRDYAQPDSVVTQWGYLTRSWPLGRLLAASVARQGVTLAEATRAWPERVRERLCAPVPTDEAIAPVSESARLILALEGRDGVQVAGAAFPPEAEATLERIAALTRRFVPLLGEAGRGDWRLRRLPVVEPWRPTDSEARELESLGGMIPTSVTRALEVATAAGLAPDDLILAQARTPQANASGPALAALVTLTPSRLLLATAGAASGATSGAATSHLEVFSLGAVSSAALQYSLLGCWFELALPASGDLTPRGGGAGLSAAWRRWAFPSPLATPFRALYLRTRSLLEVGPSLGEAR